MKSAFRDGLRLGVYDEVSEEPIRADFAEKTANPRSRSAKLRYARRGEPLDATPPIAENTPVQPADD